MRSLLLFSIGMFVSVFAEIRNNSSSVVKLAGSGETATRLLGMNDIVIKINQAGTIKVFQKIKNYIIDFLMPKAF